MALPLAEKRVPAADLWNLRVVAVDFSLAPHRKFDGITDECVASIRELVDSGIPIKNIAVYGDSAGGSMSAAVVLKMRDQEMGLPAALAMVSPWLDVTLDPDTLVSLRNQETSYTMRHVKITKLPTPQPPVIRRAEGTIPRNIQSGRQASNGNELALPRLVTSKLPDVRDRNAVLSERPGLVVPNTMSARRPDEPPPSDRCTPPH